MHVRRVGGDQQIDPGVIHRGAGPGDTGVVFGAGEGGQGHLVPFAILASQLPSGRAEGQPLPVACETV